MNVGNSKITVLGATCSETNSPLDPLFAGHRLSLKTSSRFAHFGKSNSISPLRACAAQLVPLLFLTQRVSVKIRGKYFSRLFYALSVCDLLFLFLFFTHHCPMISVLPAAFTVCFWLFFDVLSGFWTWGCGLILERSLKKFEVCDLFLIHTFQ